MEEDIKTCAKCGLDFSPKNSQQIYCGTKCRNAKNNSTIRSRPILDREHGTRTGYAKGCKCAECRGYLRKYSKEYRSKQPKPPRRPRKKRAPKPIVHGLSGYHRGCRCDTCRQEVARDNNKWRLSNPEKFSANQRRYRYRNLDKVRARSNQRRSISSDREAIEYIDLMMPDPCVYCGLPANTVEHIRPISKGGDGSFMNLAPACRGCNSSKGKKELLEFLLYKL